MKAVDPYTNRIETLKLKKPTSLCAPAVSSSGEIANPDTHLMCYRVSSGKGQSGKEPLNELNYSNSLSVGTLTTLRADELCVPTAVAR